jgi:hypothetical protein
MNFAGWLFMQTNRSVLVDFTWYLACWYTCHIMNEMTIQFCLPIRQAAGHLFSYHAEWSWHTNLISNDRTDLRARWFRANWRWACLTGCIIQIWFDIPANIIRWSYWGCMGEWSRASKLQSRGNEALGSNPCWTRHKNCRKRPIAAARQHSFLIAFKKHDVKHTVMCITSW